MYEAIMRMKVAGQLDEIVSDTYAMRRLWTKRLQNFSVREGELFWNGLKVPTLKEMYMRTCIKAGKSISGTISC